MIIGLTVGFDIALIPPSVGLLRLLLFIPLGLGLVFLLESGNSFCVVHGLRGTYDFHEKYGWPYAKTETRLKVESEDWRIRDRHKALLMYGEAAVGGLLLAILIVLV